MDTMNSYDLIVANTWYQKPQDKKVTYRDIRADINDTDYSPEQYAELDHCIVRRGWRNSIKDIESCTERYFPSHHFPTRITYRRKLKVVDKPGKIKWKGVQYEKKENIEKYNAIFNKK